MEAFLAFVLFLFPLRHFCVGVELTDSAYSAGNFLFPEHLDPMWFFSTYLSNRIGSFLVNLPGGDTMPGLNLYCGLILSLAAVFFFCLVLHILHGNLYVTFGAELLALCLCWAPVTILYHYLSYILLDLIVVFLYLGLSRDQSGWLFGAGLLLGLNVTVRFPNITGCALILAVWINGAWMKKRGKDILRQSLLCIAGALTGFGTLWLRMAFTYGPGAYTDAILQLMRMPSEASDYGTVAMILNMVLAYVEYGKSFLLLALLLILLTFLVSFGGKKLDRGVFRWGKVLLCTAAVLVLFRVWKYYGYFSFQYCAYPSMAFWAFLMVILNLVVCILGILSPRIQTSRKLLLLLMLLIQFLTPLGGNNHLYSVINNLFLLLPVEGMMLYEAFTGFTKWDDLRIGVLQEDRFLFIRDRYVSTAVIRTGLLLLVAAFALQSFCFGLMFTFRDGTDGQKRNTKIENNAILNGMITREALALDLEELTAYMESPEAKDQKLLLYGDVPALVFYLHRESAISSSWPSLRSYSTEVFRGELEKLSGKGSYPAVILSTEIRKLLEQEGFIDSPDKKRQLLWDYMASNGYKETLRNDTFSVWIKGE